MRYQPLDTTFYSNGKLLLTGEYVVLDGATALAIPTRYGQDLCLKLHDSPTLLWKSYNDKGLVWFSDEFQLDTLGSIENKEHPISKTLSQILREARNLNPNFLSSKQGYEVATHLDFPKDWGLGTSSTLINNIAQWAAVDAFKLLDNSFGGSGYDIAAAQHNTPILYTRENDVVGVEPCNLDWDFSDSLFFVYLNKKQDSREGIAHYRKHGINHRVSKRISEISHLLPKVETLSTFEGLIEEHEHLIAEITHLPKVKAQYFSDYSGSIKSLGAWGGDFILATGNDVNRDYFKQKGFSTLISFRKMMQPTDSFRTS